LEEEYWKQWKATGISGRYMFLNGLKYADMNRENIELRYAVGKMEKAIAVMQKEIISLNDSSGLIALQKANNLLQERIKELNLQIEELKEKKI
jgi:hypothetical protein